MDSFDTHIYSIYQISNNKFIVEDKERAIFYEVIDRSQIVATSTGSRFNLASLPVSHQPKDDKVCIKIFETTYKPNDEKSRVSIFLQSYSWFHTGKRMAGSFSVPRNDIINDV